MEWIFALPWADPEGFWLNVLAGVPFLVFEVFLITLLLPVAIQWWDDRRWRETRRKAVQHLLFRYRDVDRPLQEICGRQVNMMNAQSFVGGRYYLTTALSSLIENIDGLGLSIKNDIQTALPVLGPSRTLDILSLHYLWERWVREMRLLIAELDVYGIERVRPKDNAIIEAINLNYEAIAELRAALGQMWSKHVDTHDRPHLTMGTDFNPWSELERFMKAAEVHVAPRPARKAKVQKRTV